MLHLIENQANKLILPKKWRIYDVFLILLLEQDITKKKRVEDNMTQLEFKVGDNAKYKMEIIQDSAIYIKKLEAGHLPEFYYLILEKNYFKEENT